MKKLIKKSIIKVLSCLVLTLSLFSCNNWTLADFVEEANKKLPEDAGNGIVLQECSLKDDCVEMLVTYDEREFSLDNELARMAILNEKETFKSMVVDDKDMKDLLSHCKKEGKGFSIVMKGLKTGSMLNLVELKPEELPD